MTSPPDDRSQPCAPSGSPSTRSRSSTSGRSWTGTRPSASGPPLELAGAFRNMGFAYLAGHGVDQALIDRAFAEAGRFFAWPAERKAEVSVERSPCDRGWFDLGMENLDPDQQEEG